MQFRFEIDSSQIVVGVFNALFLSTFLYYQANPPHEKLLDGCECESDTLSQVQSTLVKSKARKLGDLRESTAGGSLQQGLVLQHLAEPCSKATAWAQCEEILLPQIFGKLTHVRARALGIVSKGWAKRAAQSAIIRAEMCDDKFISSIMDYAGNADSFMFRDGDKYVVETKIFEQDIEVVHCFYQGSGTFEDSDDGRLIFQLDLTPDMLQQLQADDSVEPQIGKILKLKLNFLKDFYNNFVEASGFVHRQGVVWIGDDSGCSPISPISVQVLDISENSAKLQLEPIPIKYKSTSVDHNITEIEFDLIESRYHTQLWEQHQKQQVTEGVVWYDAAVPEQLEISLRSGIDLFASRNSTDYHPFSDEIIRDLVHPSLYPFVRGVSSFFPSSDLACVPKMTDHDELEKCDRWGRKYETSAVYQWLPTYFDVGSNSVEIRGEINNLCPRAAYEGLYQDLAKLFNLLVPKLEAVIEYATTAGVRKDDGDEECDSIRKPAPAFPLRGRALQVITKIADYELQPGQSFEGVWHVEGMSHEHIVATCDYILDRDSDIDGGDLLFKRAFNKDEAARLKEEMPQDRDSIMDSIVEEGLVPLGQVATKAGRVIVFPNSHIHRLGKMTNRGPVPARRRIVVFFVVDPECRIISTQEVPDQRGTISHEAALDHRLKLMKERKFAKQDWNIRPISLCEH